MLIETLRAYSKIMSYPVCKCTACVKIYTEGQKHALVFSALKTMIIKGDFDDCPACKYLFENENIKSSNLNVCNRCSHLYEGEKCKCWEEEFLGYYRHVIRTCVPAVCPYCEDDDIEYDLGLDNNNKLIIEDNELYFIINCKNCGKQSHEFYNMEFKGTEGI